MLFRSDGGDEEPVDYAGVPHTPAARAVLDYALEEAALFSATYPIGTEHILLGLLRVPAGVGCRLLRFFGVEDEGARSTRDEFWQIGRASGGARVEMCGGGGASRGGGVGGRGAVGGGGRVWGGRGGGRGASAGRRGGGGGWGGRGGGGGGWGRGGGGGGGVGVGGRGRS